MHRNLYHYGKLCFVAILLLSASPERMKDKASLKETYPEWQQVKIKGNEGISDDLVIAQMLQENEMCGGLIIYAGCGTGEKCAVLVKEKNFIVQGLNSNRDELEKAREFARSLDLNGRLSFKYWSGGHLPYTDNLVNVLFWHKTSGEADMNEIIRVLAPHGIAYIWKNNNKRRCIRCKRDRAKR